MYLQEPKVEYVSLNHFDIASVSWCKWGSQFDFQDWAGNETCTGHAPMNHCDIYSYPTMFTYDGGCWINGQVTEAAD